MAQLRPLYAGGAAAFLLLLCTCQGTPEDSYEKQLTEAEGPALHAVYSQRLQQLMKGLSALSDRELPQELDAEAEQQQRTEQIAKIAGSMADSAASIPDILKDVDLSDEHRAEFQRIAEALGRQSRELSEAAPGLSAEEMDLRVAGIRETCNECHVRFRVLPAVDRGP